MHFRFVVLALVTATGGPHVHQRVAKQDLPKKQQDTIDLLDRITQSLPNQELYNLGNNYDIIANAQRYNESTLVRYYGGMVRAGHVQPRGTVYCNSISQLRKEVALLTRILLGADDYATFLKTAAWARVHVNEGQFVKAYIAAILQREDTQGVIPPPIYEIVPHDYVDARVIQEAQNILARGGEGLQKTVIIPVNFTKYLPGGEPQLSYFTNDVGLNTYYAYVSLAGSMIPQKTGQYPDVRESEGKYHKRGAIYYYIHKTLLTRYVLHRLSNGLGPLGEFDYEDVHVPYEPHLRYTNGLEFPGRPEELHLAHTNHHSLIKNVHAIEKRLLNAIDSGYVITPQQQFLPLYQPQGLNILGDLIEGTGRSINPRYYGSLQAVARQLLGHTPKFVNIWSYTPSALELDATAARDPAFYQLCKCIIKLFDRYQLSLPAYQYDDLVLPGVKIERIVFPDLVTYFDEHLINLDNGIVQPETKKQGATTIKAASHRLNHEPFSYVIDVRSERNYTNAVIRVFLGPKFDYDGQPIEIDNNRFAFIELDQFDHDLQKGNNVIVRNSQESPIYSADYPSVQQIKDHVDSAVTKPQHIFGFPARLTVPKGRPDDFPLQVLVMISSSEAQQISYGPVVPAEYQTYDRDDYNIVTSEQYEQYTQQGRKEQQDGIHQGGQQTVEVIPHYEEDGIYGNELNKHLAYYGNYLYMKYPIYYQHYYYGHGVGGGQQNGSYVQVHNQQYGGVDTVVPVNQTVDQGQVARGVLKGQTGHSERLVQYYKGKHISEIIGGVISLDNRPLGFPFDRSLAPSARYVPNIMVTDVIVYHKDNHPASKPTKATLTP